MNREIKFRIYSPKDKEMYNVFSFCDEYIKIKMSSGVLKFERKYFSDLMQFTGLVDKNKVEIYEGDILLNVVSINKIKSTVIYSYGRFMADMGILQSYLNSINKECVIIGNIYENPELINGAS